MEISATQAKREPRSWVITFIGIFGSAAYIAVLFWLVNGRWLELRDSELNNLGDFLAGAFGPLAIWWLVLGYFQQGIELRQNSEALMLQAKELKHSVAEQNRMANISSKQLNLVVSGLRSSLTVRYEPPDKQKKTEKHWTAVITVHNTGHDCSDLVLKWQYDISEKREYSWRFLRRFDEVSCVVECPLATIFEGTASLFYTDGTGERIEMEFPASKLDKGIVLGKAQIKTPAEAGC